jgi:hypothetical protein
MAGWLRGDKQHGGHAARNLLPGGVLAQGNESETWKGAGFVHAPFFATGRLSDAVRRRRIVSDRPQ